MRRVPELVLHAERTVRPYRQPLGVKVAEVVKRVICPATSLDSVEINRAARLGTVYLVSKDLVGHFLCAVPTPK